MAYVYRHIRLDKNEPFYIGIGTGNNYNRAKNKSKRNPIWSNIIAKTDYEVEILLDGLDFNSAKEKEKEFIALYGRIDLGSGILSNMTDGGEGMLNAVCSIETRIKRSISAKGKKRSEEMRKKMSEIAKRRPVDAILKLHEARKSKEVSDETRRKISAANKGKKPSEETRKKLSEKRTGRKASEETKRKIGKANSGVNSYLYGVKGVSNRSCKGYVKAFKDGEFVGKYEGVYDCARKLSLCPSNINRTVLGKAAHCHGYTFERVAI